MQTSISLDPPQARIGMLADEGPRHVMSAIVATDDAAPDGLNMGLGVFRLEGTDAEQEARTAEGASAVTNYTFLGVSMYDASEPPPFDTETGFNYDQGDAFPLIRYGRVWVTCETACKPGDPVFVRVVAAGAEVAGSFRNAADSTDCIQLANASFESVLTAAGMARLSLNFAKNTGLEADISGLTSDVANIDTRVDDIEAMGLNPGDTYTPTFTNGTNTTGAGTLVGSYVQLGDYVMFSIVVPDVVCTLGAPTASTFEVSLPVASDFAAVTDASGTVTGQNVAEGVLTASIANNRLVVSFDATAAASNDIALVGMYKVI